MIELALAPDPAPAHVPPPIQRPDGRDIFDGWRPREYQMPLWNHAMARMKQGMETGWDNDIPAMRAACLWHRRAGKDTTAIAIASMWALFARPGCTFWHCLPTYNQAYHTVWNAPRDGKSPKDMFPKELIKRQLEDEMLIEFTNGSTWRAVGVDKIKSVVGAPPVFVVFSEFATTDPVAWQFVQPILGENGGDAIFISTPHGKNHWYKMCQHAEQSQNWFFQSLDITQTKRHNGRPVITEAFVEEVREEGTTEEATIQSEYYVSFEASLPGTYYQELMNILEKEGRITSDPLWNPNALVQLWFDIGVSDSTAIGAVQYPNPREPRINCINYHSVTGKGLADVMQFIRNAEQWRAYSYSNFVVPHDFANRSWAANAKSAFDVALDLGWPQRWWHVVPKGGKGVRQSGIMVVKSELPTMWFQNRVTDDWREALQQYRREWSEERQVYTKDPVHDWSSHGADMTRYGCIAGRKAFLRAVGRGKPRQKSATMAIKTI